jgi:hypothetical protein
MTLRALMLHLKDLLRLTLVEVPLSSDREARTSLEAECPDKVEVQAEAAQVAEGDLVPVRAASAVIGRPGWRLIQGGLGRRRTRD